MILALHEITEHILSTDLSDVEVFTFDDGLYSQYRHFRHFLKYNKPMYFFISTGIVCTDPNKQNHSDITCQEARKQFRESGCTDYYMTWDQIKEIASHELCHVGGHGWLHHDLRGATIAMQYKTAQEDAIHMLNDFHEHGIWIDSFCFPYNHEALGYRSILQKNGVSKFFGSERTKFKE